MADIEIKIINIAAIRDAFNRAPAAMRQELAMAIKRIVFVIGRQSRINTPVDTGRLRASTYERFTGLSGEVGTNTTYDFFVHEGTRFMKAQPYLRLAVEGSQPEVDQTFTQAVNNVFIGIDRAT